MTIDGFASFCFRHFRWNSKTFKNFEDFNLQLKLEVEVLILILILIFSSDLRSNFSSNLGSNSRSNLKSNVSMKLSWNSSRNLNAFVDRGRTWDQTNAKSWGFDRTWDQTNSKTRGYSKQNGVVLTVSAKIVGRRQNFSHKKSYHSASKFITKCLYPCFQKK